MSTSVTFWGVRGSVACPGPETLFYGGNTSCVEVRAGATRLVLDAGTGLRGLGQRLMREGDVDVSLLLSHFHWDHIQGMPFFAPLFRPGTRIKIVTGIHGMTVHDALRRQMSAPTFPVDLREVPAALQYHLTTDGEAFDIGEAHIQVARLNHPDAVYAYRINHAGKSIVYATDTEHYACVDPRLVKLAQGADLLIYDSQYLPEEYAGKTGFSRVGWGHSTYEAGIMLAREAGVKGLVLFHHDPGRTDDGVRQLEARAQAEFGRVVAAREGLTLELDN